MFALRNAMFKSDAPHPRSFAGCLARPLEPRSGFESAGLIAREADARALPDVRDPFGRSPQYRARRRPMARPAPRPLFRESERRSAAHKEKISTIVSILEEPFARTSTSFRGRVYTVLQTSVNVTLSVSRKSPPLLHFLLVA